MSWRRQQELPHERICPVFVETINNNVRQTVNKNTGQQESWETDLLLWKTNVIIAETRYVKQQGVGRQKSCSVPNAAWITSDITVQLMSASTCINLIFDSFSKIQPFQATYWAREERYKPQFNFKRVYELYLCCDKLQFLTDRLLGIGFLSKIKPVLDFKSNAMVIEGCRFPLYDGTEKHIQGK